MIISDEGTVLTEELVNILEIKGFTTTLVKLFSIESKHNINSYDLSECSGLETRQALENIVKKHGNTRAFIHLHPHLEFTGKDFSQHFSKERKLIKRVFLMAKYLQKDLCTLGKASRSAFISCTRMDGKSGFGNRNNISVLAGGLNGLIKSLSLEWPNVHCRAIDIQPELDPQFMAQSIHDELHDANQNIKEVCIHAEGRSMLTAIPSPVFENQDIQTSIDEESVFLVSGGAKGVTANCVLEMAKTFKCKFILLGRSDASFELPEFAKNTSDEAELKRLVMEDLKRRGKKVDLKEVKRIYSNIQSKKEIDSTLNKIKNYGAKSIYIQADVTDKNEVKNKVSTFNNQFGKVTGIIHGAGRLADKLIQDKTKKDFDNVLSVKLDGLLSLLNAVDVNELKHLILFSSVAGFYGNVGQTDYAIANEILSKAALLFKVNHQNTHVSAINWGAWDSGMVSESLKRKFEEMGVELVNSKGGPAMMINELSDHYKDQPQMIIGGTLPAGITDIEKGLQKHRIYRKLLLNDNPFLMHHVIQGNAVLPVVNAVGWMSSNANNLYPDFKVKTIKNAQLYKGIVFDGTQSDDYLIELEETLKSNTSIVIKASVCSQNKNAKLPTYHYKCELVLVPNRFNEKSHYNMVSLDLSQSTDGKYLYDNGALFHGKYFQGIDQIIEWNDKRLVMSCVAPDVEWLDQGQFPVDSVNTFFADIQYQAMVVWVQKHHQGAKSLPLSTETCTIYEQVPFGKKMYVIMEVNINSEHKLIADCTTIDEQGKIYMYTKNAAVTISKDLKW